MFKRMLVVLIALALLVGVLPVSAEAGLPDSFIPEKFVYTFNDAVDYFARQYPNLTVSEQEALIQKLHLTFTEAEGEIAYYNNSDWSVEVSAYYEGQAVNVAKLNTPVDTIGLAFNESLGNTEILVCRGVLGAIIRSFDQSLDSDALIDWLWSADQTGDRFDLDGYSLVLLVENGIWHYTLMPASRMGMSDGETDTASSYFVPGSDGYLPGDVLLSWSGFSCQLLHIDQEGNSGYSEGNVYLSFYCRFINNSGRPLWMHIEDAKVNGVPVHGVGETGIEVGMDSGPDSVEYFFLRPDDDDTGAGRAAIINPQTVTLTLILTDDETYEDYCTAEITLPVAGHLSATF